MFFFSTDYANRRSGACRIQGAAVIPQTDTATNDDATLEALLESVQHGATIKDLKGIDDGLMEGVYAYAHRFYTNGQLDEAETFFRFLCLYDFYNGEYALGLAAVHQMKGNYQKAIDIYALAFTFLRADYRPILHAGQCQLSLGKPELARDAFEVVVQSSKDAGLVARATAYLQAMSQVPIRPTPQDEAP
jgi:type III secretion system low calcium response chaperone LcrH/SycD